MKIELLNPYVIKILVSLRKEDSISSISKRIGLSYGWTYKWVKELIKEGILKEMSIGYCVVNSNMTQLNGVDIIHDLEKIPYPFKDGCFDEIYCSHILEHLSDLVAIMEELYRISKNKTKIKILVPYFSPS